MKHFIILFLLTLIACQHKSTQPMNYNDYPIYNGTDLGLTYSKEQSLLKVWSPAIEKMRIQVYEKGHEGTWIATHQMTQDKQTGVWMVRLAGDWAGKYYTFQTFYKGQWGNEVPDPYAKATGVNGKRAMFIDLTTTNPTNWTADKRPALKHFNDIILYELHIRDVSSHASAGIKNKGKFLGLAETNTKNPDGLATGLDHFKELGVTHLHLMPAFDFLSRSVDEMKPEARYNWGYDPQNYNVPEGSYASNPYDGAVRIREFKQMVQTFHKHGLRVVMDVVYNHTGETEHSNFSEIAPDGYYYRFNGDGSFSNASACGNETASERYMMRKFMIESLKYWATEYHIDGFRVDLMGIHDIETMNMISDELEKIDPTIFVYGEGWTAGDSPLPVAQRTLKHHTTQLRRIAAFSDDIRDGLKGSVFDHRAKGFVSGRVGTKESIKFGIIASTQHPQIQYDSVNYSKAFWANQPSQTITYVSCHDNHTLYDKLKISCADAPETDILKMHRLANAIVLTSQGVPFLHAGVEFARTKQGVENSFESSDSINQIDWTRKTQYQTHFAYYKALIALRKNHPAFRMTSTTQIAQHLRFLDINHELVIGYQISDYKRGEIWNNIVVLFNGNPTATLVDIPEGNWKIVALGDKIDENGLQTFKGKRIVVPAISAMILEHISTSKLRVD